ncbi:MAG TPA: hypothetical protein VFP40_04450, partial [Terriglobales bacterium]|nr:hypothetical protein [Terriglobales bacterium]
MQQFRSSYRFWASCALFLALLLGLTACGGGSKSGGGGTFTLPITFFTSSTVVTTLPSVSMNNGDVFGLQAYVLDGSTTPVRQGTKVTWSSSDTTLLSLAADGTKCGGDSTTNTMCICAGTWDPTFVVCKPPTSGQGKVVTLTVTGGSLTTTVPVYVHPKVARVTISTPVTDCTSSTGTVQATATALDASGAAVTIGPSDQTGFTFQTSDSNVVTSDTKGLLTAVNPGSASIYAVSNSVTSVPFTFNTCAVKKISLHLTGVADTSFTVNSGTAETLVADVIDTKDKAITIANSKLTFASANNGIIGVTSAGAVGTSGPGSSSIIAACTPPNCNTGLGGVYSNPVVGAVNGTSATTIWVASKSSTSLFPIDQAAGTVGTAFTLSANPNSFISARTGLGGYLGGDTATFLFDATKGPSQGNTTPGKLLAVSNDAGKLVSFDNAAGKINFMQFVSSGSTSSIGILQQFTVSGIPNPCETTDQCPHASFTPDNNTVYVVAGSNLYVATGSSSLKTIPLGQVAKDVVVSEQGSFAYVANSNNSVDVFATCNNAKLGSNSVALAAVPQRIVSSIDGSKIYAVTPPSMSIISPSTDYTGCPPSLTDPLSSFDMGQGTFTTKQLLITSNGAKVVAITDAKILVFNTADNTTAAITLAGGATPTTGGLTLDGLFLYVGGSDSKVHKVDLT